MEIDTPTRQRSGAPALSFTGVKLEAFNPALHAKFSPNLYAFLTTRRNHALAVRARVYRDSRSRLHIGYFDDIGMFIGARMDQVLCYGTKADVSCPVNLGPLDEVQDFWTRYARDGRCAIDVEHQVAFLNNESRWQVDGDTRSCRWCGRQTQKLFTKLVTTEVKTWQSVAP